MTDVIVISPDLAYATKTNIVFPGSSTQETESAARAVALLNDRLPFTVTAAS